VIARGDLEQLDLGERAVLETRLDDHAVVDADDVVLRLHRRFAHQHGARLVPCRQAVPVRQRLAMEFKRRPRLPLGRVVHVRVGEEVGQQLPHGGLRLGDACRPERRRQVSEHQPRSPAEVLHDRLGGSASGGDGCGRVLLCLDHLLVEPVRDIIEILLAVFARCVVEVTLVVRLEKRRRVCVPISVGVGSVLHEAVGELDIDVAASHIGLLILSVVLLSRICSRTCSTCQRKHARVRGRQSTDEVGSRGAGSARANDVPSNGSIASSPMTAYSSLLSSPESAA
jgi:hypothetical protein